MAIAKNRYRYYYTVVCLVDFPAKRDAFYDKTQVQICHLGGYGYDTAWN